MSNEIDIRERPLTTLRKQELLEQIRKYVQENLDRKVTLQDVARRYNVSVSTVTQLFQKRTSSTFHQFVTQQRLTAARELISNGIPLEEVGKRVGYTDHSSFYRAFKQAYGISPRDFKLGKTTE